VPASSLQALLFPAKPYPTGCKLVPLNPWGSHCNRSGKKKEEEKKKKRHGGAKEEVPPAGGFAFAACGLRGQRLSREGFAECAERG